MWGAKKKIFFKPQGETDFDKRGFCIYFKDI